MPGRQQIPSFQLASGTTDERDLSYNLNTLGSVFYNTDTSNVEVYHEDPSNTLGWRDLVMNNKEQIDISGSLVVDGDVSFNAHLSAVDASFQNNVDIAGTLVVNDLVTTPRAGDIVNRQFTFFNEILSVNQAGSGYYYVDEMEVGFTPTYTNSHFKITMNCHYGSQSQDRMIWVAIRLYRNFGHLTAASSIETPGNANAAAWVTHNTRTTHTSQNHNNQMSGLFIDTNPSLHTDGKIYYSIGIRPVAINTTSGGASANVFRMNTTYSTTNTPKTTSQMLIEEIFVS